MNTTTRETTMARRTKLDIPEPAVPTREEVRAWREAEGLTQAEAARIAGVGMRHWRSIESGRRPVPQWLGDALMARWGSAPRADEIRRKVM
jgi:DNA-binding transcriptional regulator YiaG